jgi:hypothetical protein
MKNESNENGNIVLFLFYKLRLQKGLLMHQQKIINYNEIEIQHSRVQKP